MYSRIDLLKKKRIIMPKLSKCFKKKKKTTTN